MTLPFRRVDEARSGSAMKISFIVCVSDGPVMTDNLMRSPCLAPGTVHQLILAYGCRNAAEGFDMGMRVASGEVVVFVHQDVFLPPGWDNTFISGYQKVRGLMSAEVVGIYGLSAVKDGEEPRRLGAVNDRGEWLRGDIPLPARAQSLDELLIAVPRGSRLRLDPELGFDLYATDLVLQAESAGGCGAVIDAPCEHHSSLPRTHIPRPILERFGKAALVFERKWASRFPIETPCIRFDPDRPAADLLEYLQSRVDSHD